MKRAYLENPRTLEHHDLTALVEEHREVTIGRSEKNIIQLSNGVLPHREKRDTETGSETQDPLATVSARHATFTCVQGLIYIKDLESTNGTFVNGFKIPVRMGYHLSHGARIRLGDFLLDYKEVS